MRFLTEVSNEFVQVVVINVEFLKFCFQPAPMSCADNTNSLVDTGELVSFKTIQTTWNFFSFVFEIWHFLKDFNFLHHQVNAENLSS